MANNTNSSDEIDLSQLFQLIGRAFQRLFDFIASIFKGIFHVIIVFLLFLRRYFIWICIAIVVGVVGGFLLDGTKTPEYISIMVVEPNFDSAGQLLDNIVFYNDLANAKDSMALSTALNISIADAATIQEVYVDSSLDENEKIKLLDTFIKELDTTTTKFVDIESYLRNFKSVDAKFHQVVLISTDASVAKKAQPAIVGSIVSNAYFSLQKQVNDKNIEIQDSIIKQQFIEIDTLQSLYKKVLLKEVDRPMQGTNINLAENGTSQNKEFDLLKERENLKNQLLELNKEKANKSSIINIMSAFPTKGVKVKGFLKSYIFILPLAFLGTVFGVLGLLKLNEFLKGYKTGMHNEDYRF